MDLREEFEARVKKLENFIEEKGIGSKQLSKVRDIQKKTNVAIFLGSVITIAGIAIWALNRD
ncbi:MAG: hypothetical protein ACOC4J_04490 [Bacteroidota bacterium]